MQSIIMSLLRGDSLVMVRVSVTIRVEASSCLCMPYGCMSWPYRLAIWDGRIGLSLVPELLCADGFREHMFVVRSPSVAHTLCSRGYGYA